jgi:hypothetical protein
MVATCGVGTPVMPPAEETKVLIEASDSGHLEMHAGDGCQTTCRKMVVKMGDHSLAFRCEDGKVCVRSPELKATAKCVRTNGKDHLVLEGDAVLRYHKDGQRANVSAQHIDVNLLTGSVTIESITSPPRASVRTYSPAW